MNVFHKGYTPSFLHKPNCRKPVCCGVHTYKHAGKIYVNSVPNLRPTYNPIQPKKGRGSGSAGTADRKIALCFAFRKIQRIRCYIRFGKWSPFGPPWREKVEGKKFCVCVQTYARPISWRASGMPLTQTQARNRKGKSVFMVQWNCITKLNWRVCVCVWDVLQWAANMSRDKRK